MYEIRTTSPSGYSLVHAHMPNSNPTLNIQSVCLLSTWNSVLFSTKSQMAILASVFFEAFTLYSVVLFWSIYRYLKLNIRSASSQKLKNVFLNVVAFFGFGRVPKTNSIHQGLSGPPNLIIETVRVRTEPWHTKVRARRAWSYFLHDNRLILD